MIQGAIDVLTGRTVTATANLGGVVGVAMLAVGFLKHLRGRTIQRRSEVDPAGQITIVFNDGTTMTIPAASFELAQRLTFRQRVRSFVAPLDREGVTEVRLEHRDTEISIGQEDVPAFEVPEIPDELLLAGERDAVLSLVSVAFREGNKWKFSDGAQTFWAEVHDIDFLNRVQTNQESFRSGDMLRVSLLSRSYRTDEGLRTDYTVTRVSEHVPGAQSVPLPFESSETDDPEDGYPPDDPRLHL